MPATATEQRDRTSIDDEIKEREDRHDELEERRRDVKDKVRKRRREAARARARGDYGRADELDTEREELTATLESNADALERVEDQLEMLARERERREGRERRGQLKSAADDLVDREKEAWTKGLEKIEAGIESIRKAGEARERYAAYIAEIRLLTKLFDLDDVDVPNPLNGDELSDHVRSASALQTELSGLIQATGRRDAAKSLRASVAALLRHPPADADRRLDVFRTARGVMSKLSEGTRAVAKQALTDRLWKHYENLDDDRDETIAPPEDSG